MAEIKRLNYFTSQFLEEGDFLDEQHYMVDMRRRHNRTLHRWGVVEGLQVSKTAARQVSVTPGMAIDSDGREIVLPADPAPQPLDPSLAGTGTNVFITIAYREVNDPADAYTTAGVTGKFKRITERPDVKAQLSPPNDGSVVILARVVVDANGDVGAVDNTVRTAASSVMAPGTDLELRTLKWGNNSRLTIDQGGSIELGGDNSTKGTGSPYIDFHFNNKLEDFNARIINEADGRLTFQVPVVRTSAAVEVRGNATVSGLLRFADGAGTVYQDNWLGMASNIDGTTKWLHIGGITDQGERRITLQGSRIHASGNLGVGTAAPGARLTIQRDGTSSAAASAGKALFVSAVMGTGGTSDGGIEFRHDNLSQGIGFGYNTIYATGSNANQDLTIQSRGTGNVFLNPSQGNVSIGSSSAPDRNLTVRKSGQNTGVYANLKNDATEVLLGVDSTAVLSAMTASDLQIRTNNATRMVVQANTGNVGVGAGSPESKLHVKVAASSSAIGALTVDVDSFNTAANAQASYFLRVRDIGAGPSTPFYIRGDGAIGVGTDAPAAKLHIINVNQDANGNTLVLGPTDKANLRMGYNADYSWIQAHGSKPLLINSAGNTTMVGPVLMPALLGRLMVSGSGAEIGFLKRTLTTWPTTPAAGDRYLFYNQDGIARLWTEAVGNLVEFDTNGNVGTHKFPAAPKKATWGGGIHTWDLEAEGTIWSARGIDNNPHDLAENYLSDMDLAPGDVVCLDRDRDRIVPSERPNDVLLLGVISTEPGVLLNAMHGEEDSIPGMLPYPVALCGRVPCKVTDENGPIARGDLLTTSSRVGHAMKASPIRVEGVEVYRSGTIIGKALEPHKAGKGMIEVFVALR